LKANSQYDADVDKLAGLIKQLAGIPKTRTANFIKETGASEIFASSYALCETDRQRAKLHMLHDFINTLDMVQDNQKGQEYYLNSSTKTREYFKSFFSGMNDKEYFAAAFLDARGKIMSSKIMFEGTIDESPVYL
jgi:DNA repair protein RadC